MKITKSELKKLVEEVLIEEVVDSSVASNIVKMLQSLIGKELKLQPGDIVKYGTILDDPKKTTTLSSVRTSLIKKITYTNKETINADEAFLIVRALEGLSYFSPFIMSNKTKFQSFLEAIFDKSEVKPTTQPDVEETK